MTDRRFEAAARAVERWMTPAEQREMAERILDEVRERASEAQRDSNIRTRLLANDRPLVYPSNQGERANHAR